MKNIHDWVFHFNTYTNKWYAAKREHANDLFSKLQSGNIIGSSEIATLITIIERTNGDKKKLKEMFDNQIPVN